MVKKIIYDNRTFSLGTAGTYYFATKQAKTISLHRYKYEKEIGPIPEGWDVHHKDGNCFNNDKDNLEAISPQDHAKLHPVSEETLKKWHEAGIKAAPAWHKSEEGKQWHRKNYYNNSQDILQRKHLRNCSNCDMEVQTKRKNTNAFCSNACKSAWRRNNKPDMATKCCDNCGKEFETKKYLPARFCSRACWPSSTQLRKSVITQ